MYRSMERSSIERRRRKRRRSERKAVARLERRKNEGGTENEERGRRKKGVGNGWTVCVGARGWAGKQLLVLATKKDENKG